jgi:hypothetical protein
MLALGGVTWAQTERLKASQAREVSVKAEFEAYKAQVKANGERAERERQEKEARNEELARKSDELAKDRMDKLDKERLRAVSEFAAYRLRVRAGRDATSRIVPEASSDPADGDRVCYSRATLSREVEAAFDRFGERLSTVEDGAIDDTEPYDKAIVTARICREWALKR